MTVAVPGLVAIAVNESPEAIVIVVTSPVTGRVVFVASLRNTRPSDPVTTNATPGTAVPATFFREVVKFTAERSAAVVDSISLVTVAVAVVPPVTANES